MTQVPNLKLNSDKEMPAFGFGTWQLADGKEVISSVTSALEAGYRLIDTAKIYGNEQGVGKAIKNSGLPREEIFLTTKLWPADFGYNSVLKAFDASLDRLGMEYVDLYLMHWPEHDKQARQEAWRALEQIHKDGRARSIGVSNYMVEHLEEVLSTAEIPPAVNQIEFHPFIYQRQLPALNFSKKHGVVVEAYSPLTMGHNLNDLVITAIAKKNGKSNAQVVLRWCLQHGTVPIPRSTNPSHIKENIDIFGFKLSDEDMKSLDGLGEASSWSPNTI